MNKTYTYEELNPKAKEKAKEYYIDIYKENKNDSFEISFQEELKKIGFENLYPYFYFEYTKNSGCSLNGNIYLKEVLNNKYIIENLEEEELNTLKQIEKSISYKIRVNSNNSYKSSSMKVTGDDIKDKNIKKIADKLIGIIEEYLKSICKEKEEIGFEIINSEESLEEELIYLEYEFESDGTMI